MTTTLSTPVDAAFAAEGPDGGTPGALTPELKASLEQSMRNREAREALVEARRPHVEEWLTRFSDDGRDVILPLAVALKAPIVPKWSEVAETDWDYVEERLRADGNIGLLLGSSRRVCLDGDNAEATAAILAAGWHLHTVSPGSRNPLHGHAGGAHTLWRLPTWVPNFKLTGPTSAVLLENGAKIDVLAGPHQVVLPPSVVVTSEEGQPFHAGTYVKASEAGYCAPAQDGWLLEDAGDDLILPLWMLSDEILAYAPPGTEIGTPPPGMEPLAGTIGFWRPKASKARDGQADDELTQAVDAWPFLEKIAEAGVLGSFVGYDRCGDNCAMWLRAGSSSAKSITKHDCDEHGGRVQVWTTAFPNLPQGGYSAIDAYIGLTGGDIEADRGRVLAEQGLITPRVPAGVYASDFEDVAIELETRAAAGETTVPGPARAAGADVILVEVGADGLLQRAKRCREAAAAMTAGHRATVTKSGATFNSAQVLGALDPEVEDDTEEETEPEVQLDMTLHKYTGTPPRKGQLMEYPVPPVPAHVQSVEGATTTWRDVLPPIVNESTLQYVTHEWIFGATPGLSHVAAAADARGVTRWGMLGALLPRVAAKIPATVRLVPASGNLPEDVSATTAAGTSINVYSVLVGNSGSGKTDTMTAATSLIPGVRTLPPGTGEGVLKEFPRVSSEDGDAPVDGVPEISNGVADTESLMIESDEIDVFVGEMMRQGSKTTGWYRSMWMGGEVGNTASEADRRSCVAAHSYRFGILLGAQPDAVAPMFNETGKGTPQRFMWLPAQQSVPRGAYPERLQVPEVYWFNGNPLMIPASVQRSPVWVYPPAAAKEALKRARWAAATSDALASPRVADRAEAIANRHAVLQQLKISVLLAALDGLAQPQDTHWFVAEALMEVRRRSIHQLVEEADRVKAEGEHVKGTYAGLAHHAANAARDAARESHVARCAKTIMNALIRDAEKGLPPRTFAEAKKALSAAKGAGDFSDRKLYGTAALAMVLRDPAVANLGERVQFVGKPAAA